jgi:hypothetical protein
MTKNVEINVFTQKMFLILCTILTWSCKKKYFALSLYGQCKNKTHTHINMTVCCVHIVAKSEMEDGINSKKVVDTYFSTASR